MKYLKCHSNFPGANELSIDCEDSWDGVILELVMELLEIPGFMVTSCQLDPMTKGTHKT